MISFAFYYSIAAEINSYLIIIFFLVCTTTVPDIENGMQATPTGGDDTAPYFIGEFITYVCDDNYDADPADLTNECIQNPGSGAPAIWLRMTNDLSNVCQLGKCLLF